MCGAELKTLPEGVQRVLAVLQSKGHPHMPVMLDDAARTAQQAADALGRSWVGQMPSLSRQAPAFPLVACPRWGTA
jgi:hypothetical protein